jgi:hypothetical protein
MSDLGDKTMVAKKMIFSIIDAILIDVQTIEQNLQPALPWIIP